MNTKYNPINLILDTYDYSIWFEKEKSTDTQQTVTRKKNQLIYYACQH